MSHAPPESKIVDIEIDGVSYEVHLPVWGLHEDGKWLPTTDRRHEDREFTPVLLFKKMIGRG